MKNTLLVFGFLLSSIMLFAQNETRFTVSVSTDSILLGNTVEVKFTLEGSSGSNFAPPLFNGFTVVSGPNTSTSMSFTNGQMMQRISYTYYLKPNDIGNYYIEPASVETAQRVLESEPIEVMVYPNPDGVIQQPPQYNQDFRMDFGDPFGGSFGGSFFDMPNIDSLFQQLQLPNDFFNNFDFDSFDEMRKELFEQFNMDNFEFPEMPSDSILQEQRRKRTIKRI